VLHVAAPEGAVQRGVLHQQDVGGHLRRCSLCFRPPATAACPRLPAEQQQLGTIASSSSACQCSSSSKWLAKRLASRQPPPPPRRMPGGGASRAHRTLGMPPPANPMMRYCASQATDLSPSLKTGWPAGRGGRAGRTWRGAVGTQVQCWGRGRRSGGEGCRAGRRGESKGEGEEGGQGSGGGGGCGG
jgi:hypothetical protein